MKYFLLPFVSLLIVALDAAPFANGNFETRTASYALLPLGDRSVVNWVVGGTQSSAQWVSRYPDSTNHCINFGPIGSGATQWIEQTFDTSPNVEYRIAFTADGRNEVGFSGVRFDVLDAGGAALASKEFAVGGTAAMSWAQGGVMYFTASSTSSTLRITYVARDTSAPLVQIDDVELAPRAPKADISAYAAIRVEGFPHTGYRIEYSATDGPLLWRTLTDVWINDVQPIVIDTNSPSVGARIYRVIELPTN